MPLQTTSNQIIGLRRAVFAMQAALAGLERELNEVSGEPEKNLSPVWLPLADAAARCGVKTGTLRSWCRTDDRLARRHGKKCWSINLHRLRQRLGLISS